MIVISGSTGYLLIPTVNTKSDHDDPLWSCVSSPDAVMSRNESGSREMFRKELKGRRVKGSICEHMEFLSCR